MVHGYGHTLWFYRQSKVLYSVVEASLAKHDGTFLFPDCCVLINQEMPNMKELI